MDISPARRKAMVTTAAFWVVPCILGTGIAQYLRWSDFVWLSNAGAFWPVVCAGTSVAVVIKFSVSPSNDRAARFWAWLVLTWTWLYFPLWLTAKEIPQSSAVISRNGRTFVASEWAGQPTDKVWLLTGLAGKKIVHNVAGTITVNAVDVRYRYADSYISARGHEEDLSKPVLRAANAILTLESKKSRSSRIALFEAREVHEQLLTQLCRAIVSMEMTCPLKLNLSPQSDATSLGQVWSKYYTEMEAIDEKHLPTLLQLLTQENSRLVDRDRVFALFMDLANTPEQLSMVARKSHTLNEYQFDELIRRFLRSPRGGNEAVGILTKVNRLTQEQRQELRDKVFREASLAVIAKHVVALRISDAEVARLATRMRASLELTPDAAVLALETFGERLPLEAQHDAIEAVVNGDASHAIGALQHVNFSSKWREKLLKKVLTYATYQDFEAAHLSREMLEDLLTPSEMRVLISSVIGRSETSPNWLKFAVQVLPIRAMTFAERKAVLNGLLFESNKSALEFVSENRNYLEADDVNEVTYDYTKTITPDLCLHLSHRNKNRKVDYFSESQLQIFRDCAQSK